MIGRNGEHVAERLDECSLYQSELDLAVYAPNGEVAGYGLFWPDSITAVEAMRRGARYYQCMVGAIGIGDERLLAVQREAVAAFRCHRGGADRVAAGIGLGDRKAEAGLAAAGIGQITRLLRFGAVFGDEAEAHRRAHDEVQERNAVVRQPLQKQVHLCHSLAGAAEFLGHHGPDKTVIGDLPIQCLRKHVLVGAVHPVSAVEFLGDGISIVEDLPLLVREIKVHGSGSG